MQRPSEKLVLILIVVGGVLFVSLVQWVSTMRAAEATAEATRRAAEETARATREAGEAHAAAIREAARIQAEAAIKAADAGITGERYPPPLP